MSVLVPTVIESEGRFERAYDIYSRLLKDRIVFVGDEINEVTANLVVAQLLFLQAQDNKKDIFMYVNSPGGSVYDGLAIIDTMNFVTCDVQTVGIGMQASMGAILLSNGAKGKRFLLPNSTVMIHQPAYGGPYSKVTDQEITLKESMRLKKRLHEIMAENTGQTIEKVTRDMDRDYWMNADEAKKYGIVDKIITSPPKGQ